MYTKLFCVLALLAGANAAPAVETDAQRVQAVLPQITAWRRDIHQHPELSNREVRTSKLVADELKKLGYTVRTGLAHTGVTGVLVGG
jgi:amidohydrolase